MEAREEPALEKSALELPERGIGVPWVLIFALPVLAAAAAAALGFRGSDVQLGVDLGTTYSAVAVSDGGGAWRGAAGGAASPASRIVPGADGAASTPSVIAVRGAEFLVGAAAERHLARFPHEGVLDAKRVIGRRRASAAARGEALRHSGRLMQHPRAFRSASTGRPFVALAAGGGTGRAGAGSSAGAGAGAGALLRLAWARVCAVIARASDSRIGRTLGLGGRPAVGGFAAVRPCDDCEREIAFAVQLARQTAHEARVLASHACVDEGSLIELELDGEESGTIVSGNADSSWNWDDLPPETEARLLMRRLRSLSRESASAPVRYLMMTPQAASCLILGYIRASVQRDLPHVSLGSATACVPAEFDAVQRRASLEAFARAGIVVARTMHEPIAAAVAYGLDRRADVRFVLVFDMGGGTLDVAVLFLGEGGAFTTVGTAGDNSLGGEDFDDCLGSAMAAEAAQSGDTAFCAPEALSTEAERVKIALSADGGPGPAVQWRCPVARAVEAGGSPGRELAAAEGELKGSITRAEFERACAPLFERSTGPVRQALENANVRADEVDELVLVGGSSRLPGVRETLRAYFGGRELRFTVDPDLAVALGAALSRS